MEPYRIILNDDHITKINSFFIDETDREKLKLTISLFYDVLKHCRNEINDIYYDLNPYEYTKYLRQ